MTQRRSVTSMNVAAPLTRCNGKIVFLDKDGAEVEAGSPDAVSVRTTGFSLLKNGDFRIAATFHHPCPPKPSRRRCRTRGGVLPQANPRPASSDDDEVVADEIPRVSGRP